LRQEAKQMKIKPTYVIAGILIILSVALAYDAFNSYIDPYLSVSEVVENNSAYANKDVQVLGKVVNGSSGWMDDGSFLFNLTDGLHTIRVTYSQNVPQNFMENQDVVVIGRLLSPFNLNASEMLVKCPSRYEGGETSLLSDPVFIAAIVLAAAALIYYVVFVLLRKS
jgi:cytochrome c-type biogenesis protein CcmE